MDEFIVMVGLALLTVPILVVVLCVVAFKLSRRVQVLEGLVHHLISSQSGADVNPKAADAPGSKTPVAAAPHAALAQSGAVATPPQLAARTQVLDPAKGPWAQDPATRTPLPPRHSPPPAAPRGPDAMTRLGDWLRENWFYAVAALSLALAGIFLVQYGVENGLFPPSARVISALLFGAVCIAGGEWIRKRYGDGEDSATAYLPSVFSGAGLVILFAALVAARQLYGLIGAEIALAGLIAVALGALVLGWLHGPLLAAVGITGAMLAPFVVGGDSTDIRWLFGYFALVAALGLSVDAIRRWAWVSVLTLVLAYGAGLILAAGAFVEPYATLYLVALALMAVAVPGWRVWPAHDGPAVAEVLARKAPTPYIATWIAAGGVVASVLGLVQIAAGGDEAAFWLAVAGLAVLGAALMTWAQRASALQDLAAVPLIGLAAIVAVPAFNAAPLAMFQAPRLPETAMPLQVSILIGLGAVLSGLAAWRAFQPTRYGAVWAGAAAMIAPLMALTVELTWHPALALGPYVWALHIAALAVMQVVLAERFARVDGPNARLRMSLAVLSALSLTAFFCVLMLSSAALTVALAVTVVAAVALDRRFDLPVMVVFIALGIVAIGARLVVDPGLDWAKSAPLASVLLAYGGAFAACVAGVWLLRGRADRDDALVWLDSAAWSTGGLLASVLMLRAIAAFNDGLVSGTHWAMGLASVIWFGVALAQVQRALALRRMVKVRLGLAMVFGLIGALALLGALTEANPLGNTAPYQAVIGVPLINTLAVAYLLPALVLAAGVVRLQVGKAARQAGLAVAAGLTGLWAFGVVRHFWQGAEKFALTYGFGQSELYSYTVVLLALGAGLFYQAVARRSVVLRKAGLGVIGLAVVKVFLIDISGLDGLVRVVSLLGLALVLAGLAWLNRWAIAKAVNKPGDSPDDRA